MFIVLSYSDKFSKSFGPFSDMETVLSWLNLQSDEFKHEVFDLIPPINYSNQQPSSQSSMVVFIGKDKYLTHCYGPFPNYSHLIDWLNAHYAANAELYRGIYAGNYLYRCLKLINPKEKVQ